MVLKYVFKRHLKKRLILIALSIGIISTMSWILFVATSTIATAESDSGEREDLRAREDHLNHKHVPEPRQINFEREQNEVHKNLSIRRPSKVVDMWSTVGLGDFTWEHILGGSKRPGEDEAAELTYGSILLRYHSKGFDMEEFQDSKHVLLVLNGRAEERLPYTKIWLEELSSMAHLQTAFLMLIGNEECDNGYLSPYLAINGGVLQKVFVTYDTPLVDESAILQWPLGSATYRGFPLEDRMMLLTGDSRPYRCNFLGTVYPGSTRKHLLDIIEQFHLRDYCYIKTRQQWPAEEETQSMQEYVQILQQSDLTLSPVGKNVECYRIYEAAAMGSIPVVEDVRTSYHCSERTLRVLKDRGAPFIFIKDWSELPEIMRREMRLTPETIIERRKSLIEWYHRFKEDLRELLFGELEKNL